MLIPGPKKIRRKWREFKSLFYMIYYPKRYADLLYFKTFGHYINWKEPRDLNEWINYLAFNTDTHDWSRLSDKLAARDYVSSRGLDSILIPIYGVWDNANDIDFNLLPNSFVLKTNHACGDTIMVTDKSSIDTESIRQHIRNSLSLRFGVETAEPHYLRIAPKIFAEQLVPPPLNIDYKVWCFHGIPECIMTISNRDIESGHYCMNVYDLDWNKHPEWVTTHYQNSIEIPKPKRLNEMIDYARILSKGFPQVRVDFYHTNKGIFFGELTFTSACGRMTYFTEECLISFGNKVKKGF